MKRKFEVRWYEHNLTQEKSRKFFLRSGEQSHSLPTLKPMNVQNRE